MIEPLDPIEIEFQKINPYWINKIDNFARDPSFENRMYLDPLKEYKCCFVGDVRAHLGLSRDYAVTSFLRTAEPCPSCNNLAADIFDHVDKISQDNRNKAPYINDLKRFKRHLKEVHKKEL
jgi:hypothetical protein